MRFQAAENSRETYRENGQRLIKENEELQVAVRQVRYWEEEEEEEV